MRYLLISDVHANLPALDAVLLHASQRGYDATIFLGDAVGYYPHAEEALQRLIALDPAVRILGNHDAALLDMIAGEGEKRDASVVSEVLERHLEALSDDSIACLRTLKTHHVAETWEATHGALGRRWDYLATLGAAQATLPLMTTRLLFVGHTHCPKVFAAVNSAGQEMWRTVAFRHERGQYRVPPL